jgi:hypothetical protein
MKLLVTSPNFIFISYILESEVRIKFYFQLNEGEDGDLCINLV